MAYRLVRKLRASIKTHEIALLSVALALALVFGCGAGVWYRDAGRDSWLVSSANRLDANPAATHTPAVEPIAVSARGSFDLYAPMDDVDTSGFFTSSRARLLPPDSNFTASYLSLSDGSPVHGADGAAPADAEENTGDESENIQDVLLQERNTGPAEDSKYSGAAKPGAAEADIIEGLSGEGDPDQPTYTVKVIYYGERHVIQTVGMLVSELFDKHGFTMSEHDKMTGAYLDGLINSDLFIEIKRVTTKTITEDVKIPAKTAYRDNSDLTHGQSRVIRNAVDGLKRVEYLLTYENGVQVSKSAVKEDVITEAVSGIIEQGSTGTRKGKDGVQFTYSKVIDVKCTAYTSSYEDTGKHPGDPAFGITKSGMAAREGIVAVDPSVIPLGTKMYIEILDDNVEDYGIAIAGDTGGKIKGKKVDLYFDAPREELLKFGVRKAKVYIID